MVPGDLARRVTAELDIPTVGIGAGPGCDAQVLVWQDAMGLRQGKMSRFVKQYAAVADVLAEAASAYVSEVGSGAFPGPEHTFLDAPAGRAAEADPAGNGTAPVGAEPVRKAGSS